VIVERKPNKLSDVYQLKVDLKPVTRCEPPEGTRCDLELGRTGMSLREAKYHALLNPGHYVVRDQTTRTCYVLEVEP
jgi:hypothetical protein